MEELQKTLVAKISEQLKKEGNPNLQYLDSLNRLLGTVSNFMIQEAHLERQKNLDAKNKE